MTLYVICQGFSIASVIDLGTHGPVFKVEEENMILHLKNKLQKLESEGKLKDLKNQWKEKIKNTFKKPQAVQNITHTKTPRSFKHDPSLVIQNDIKTPKGEILARKGDRINPLHTLKPEKGFLFIDGDEKTHVEFAKKHLHNFEVVLVNGSPLEVEEHTKAQTFFDQGGYLTNHYGVTQVPAFLSVKEDHLLIEEVVAHAS